MKTRFHVQTVFLCSLFLSCAEAPEYTPRPQQPVTSTAGGKQSATQSPGAPDTQKTANNKDTSTMTPEAPKPAPTPGAAPAPNPSAGVVATGKTLVMQSCAASCHGAMGTPIDARNEAMLAAASANLSHQADAIRPFFVQPAAGAAATSFTHIAAYLATATGKLVQGPTLP